MQRQMRRQRKQWKLSKLQIPKKIKDLLEKKASVFKDY